MKKSCLYGLWALMFVLCSGLGFLAQPGDTVQKLMTLLSLLFFLPPAMVLYRGIKDHDRASVTLVRNLAALSLLLTVLTLIGNFLSVIMDHFWGNVFHYLLVILSCPMVCCGYWALSLFCWACLLFISRKILKKMEC